LEHEVSPLEDGEIKVQHSKEVEATPSFETKTILNQPPSKMRKKTLKHLPTNSRGSHEQCLLSSESIQKIANESLQTKKLLAS